MGGQQTQVRDQRSLSLTPGTIAILNVTRQNMLAARSGITTEEVLGWSARPTNSFRLRLVRAACGGIAKGLVNDPAKVAIAVNRAIKRL